MTDSSQPGSGAATTKRKRPTRTVRAARGAILVGAAAAVAGAAGWVYGTVGSLVGGAATGF
jgi:hypothetical protein